MRNLKNEICFCLNDPTWVESIYASEKYELILKKINTTIPLATINQEPVMAVSVRDITIKLAKDISHFCLLGSIFYVSQTPDVIDFNFDEALSDWLQKSSALSEVDTHNNIIELLEQLFTFMDIVNIKLNSSTQITQMT